MGGTAFFVCALKTLIFFLFRTLDEISAPLPIQPPNTHNQQFQDIFSKSNISSLAAWKAELSGTKRTIDGSDGALKSKDWVKLLEKTISKMLELSQKSKKMDITLANLKDLHQVNCTSTVCFVVFVFCIDR